MRTRKSASAEHAQLTGQFGLSDQTVSTNRNQDGNRYHPFTRKSVSSASDSSCAASPCNRLGTASVARCESDVDGELLGRSHWRQLAQEGLKFCDPDDVSTGLTFGEILVDAQGILVVAASSFRVPLQRVQLSEVSQGEGEIRQIGFRVLFHQFASNLQCCFEVFAGAVQFVFITVEGS